MTSGSVAIATDVNNATLVMLESPVMTVALPVIYLLVFLCSTPCNLLSLGALLSIKSGRHTSTSVLALNLSVSDLLYSQFLPLQAIYHLRGNDWRWSTALCTTSTNMLFCNSYVSILTTTAIAVERYCGVVHPLRTKPWRTPLLATAVCLAIWALVLVTQTPLLNADLLMHVAQLNVTTCFDVFPRAVFNGKSFAYLYFSTTAVLFYLLPLLVLLSCYVAVGRALCRSTAMTYGDKRSTALRYQALAVITLATVSFAVCYLPTVILHVLHLAATSRGETLYQYYKLSVGINSLNCCLDPFLYYFASREFRQNLWAVSRRCCSCFSVAVEDPPGSSEMAFAVGEQHQTDGRRR